MPNCSQIINLIKKLRFALGLSKCPGIDLYDAFLCANSRLNKPQRRGVLCESEICFKDTFQRWNETII